MKTSLLAPRAALPETTVELLLECHERIRRHARAAIEVLGADVSDERIAQTARALVSYFGRALPLHAQDEDCSIRPRLEAAGLFVPEVRALSREHDEMHELLDRMIPRWSMIAEAPSIRESLAPKLEPITRELVALVDEHLRVEEELVFPALRELLTRAEDEAIVREMRARRA